MSKKLAIIFPGIGYTVDKNIKDVRSQRKMSQKSLATACGFSNTTLSAYEDGS